jgi:hypothetical protein
LEKRDRAKMSRRIGAIEILLPTVTKILDLAGWPA